MSKWLQNFAYSANIDVPAFAAAGVLSLLISLLTIFSQSYRAATANPATSIRNE